MFTPGQLPIEIVAPETVSQGGHVLLQVCNLRATPFNLQAGWALGHIEEVDIIPPPRHQPRPPPPQGHHPTWTSHNGEPYSRC